MSFIYGSVKRDLGEVCKLVRAIDREGGRRSGTWAMVLSARHFCKLQNIITSLPALRWHGYCCINGLPVIFQKTPLHLYTVVTNCIPVGLCLRERPWDPRIINSLCLGVSPCRRLFFILPQRTAIDERSDQNGRLPFARVYLHPLPPVEDPAAPRANLFFFPFFESGRIPAFAIVAIFGFFQGRSCQAAKIYEPKKEKKKESDRSQSLLDLARGEVVFLPSMIGAYGVVALL